jgi:hypothetical protein
MTTIARMMIMIITALALAAVPSTAQAAQPRTWKPCLTSATMNCVWDAKHMGRSSDMGRQSFIRWQQGPDANYKVILRFVSHEQAHRLLMKRFGER